MDEDVGSHEDVDWYSVCTVSGNDIRQVCLRLTISWLCYTIVNVC